MVLPHEHSSEDVLFCNECGSHWAIRTLSDTTYVIDLRARTATRLPDEVRVNDWLALGGVRLDALPMPLEMVNQSPGLRRDGEPIPFIWLGECRLGRSLPMVLNLVGDGIHVTTRMTTPVVAARWLDPVS